MEFDRGALVTTVARDGQRRLARVVVGPHFQGEFEVLILCKPDDWEIVAAESRPTDDFWGEACFVWTVEAVEPANERR